MVKKKWANGYGYVQFTLFNGRVKNHMQDAQYIKVYPRPLPPPFTLPSKLNRSKLVSSTYTSPIFSRT